MQLEISHSRNAELREQHRLLTQTELLPTVLEAMPGIVLIINDRREIVYANREAYRVLHVEDLDQILGKRPGEAMGCSVAASCSNGCGTGEACAVCGAASAIRAAEMGKSAVRECRIRRYDTGIGMDFRVSTTPLNIQGVNLTLVALIDISHENRRRALERIFFHDLLNTLGALSGYAQLLQNAYGSREDMREFGSAILHLTETMAEQIYEQRDLAAAENNDLSIRPSNLNARELLEEVAVLYRNHAASRDRSIVIGEPAEGATLRTDKRLLQRIIANMVKNALEASMPGGRVTLTCWAEDHHVHFEVHNHGVIPRDVQLQIFQRAFSTKGTGRGLGTYSMKLLGERYLKGSVNFTSTPETGTIFRAIVPQYHPGDGQVTQGA